MADASVSLRKRARFQWTLSTTGVLLAAGASLIVGPSCLERWDDRKSETAEARCAKCHGDPTRPGDFLERAAPPRDLLGASDPSYPGVGAHSIHLNAAETHGAIACSECHVVPERTDSPGHADDDRPAETVFGALATTGGHQPSYDTVSRRCSDSYCHRDAEAVWTEPRTSVQACGSCHGLPPPAPHPQSQRCEACHGDVVDSARAFINPALHVDGLVEVSAGNCSYCHGSAENPAPPSDTGGGSLVTLIGVGAHQAHLQGGSSSRPLECAECHLVPSAAEDPGHADGLPAEVTFSGIAAARDHTPSWDHVGANCSDTYCHGPTSPSPSPPPSWIEPGSLSCSSCHGAPPPAPHPQLTNCSHCHADTIADDDVTVFDRERHVDGVVDVDFDQACTSCHGDQNPAPPFDLAGHTATSALGVGAHQTHVLGTATSRPVPCNECHVVPEDVLDPGHIDTAGPAEVVLSGTAAAFGGTPSYMAGSCQNLSCHGALFPKGHKSGGTNTEPIWNHVDGTQATCGSCHGLPPPAPHPYNTPNCILCHEDVAADGQTFTRPDLHVDGIVTFTVP